MVFLVLCPLMYELLHVGVFEGHWLNIDFFLLVFVILTYLKIQIQNKNLVVSNRLFICINALQYFFFCCVFWLYLFWSIELFAHVNYSVMVALSVYKEIHRVLFVDLRTPMEIICGYFQVFSSSLDRLFTYRQRLIAHFLFFWQKSKQFEYLHLCFNFLYKTYKNFLAFMMFFSSNIPPLFFRLIDLWYAILALFEGASVKFLTYFNLLKNPRYKNFKKDEDFDDDEKD